MCRSLKKVWLNVKIFRFAISVLGDGDGVGCAKHSICSNYVILFLLHKDYFCTMNWPDLASLAIFFFLSKAKALTSAKQRLESYIILIFFFFWMLVFPQKSLPCDTSYGETDKSAGSKQPWSTFTAVQSN